MMHRNFHTVVINGQFVDNGTAVLVIANHVSWWDGFWVEYLNQQILHRRFHFMMLEDQLKKHWYFQFTGGFSVKKQSRSVIESLQYCIELLKQPANLVLMFPQGKIHSMHNHNFRFEKGIEKIVSEISPDTQILLVVNLIDYLSAPKPSLYIYFKSLTAKDITISDVESEYQKFFTETVQMHKIKTS